MKSKITFTQTEADEIILLINEKLNADSAKQKGIRAKIRNRGFYASEFGFKEAYTVSDFLRVIKIVGSKTITPNKSMPENNRLPKHNRQFDKEPNTQRRSDESYIVDLCDEVLQLKALRQYRFDFLRGDAGTKLPVDAYYPSLNLVVEFRERQHTEEVKFFDRRQTVSGVGRGEQRKLYDQLRRDILPKNGITLVELDYELFEHTRNKKLIRNKESDLKVVVNALKMHMK